MTQRPTVSDETKAKMSASHLEIWKTPGLREERSAILKAKWAEDYDARSQAVSADIKARWEDPVWAHSMAQAQSAGATNRWADPVKRAALLQAQRRGRAARKNK